MVPPAGRKVNARLAGALSFDMVTPPRTNGARA
jgi:hypothetical protein